MKVVVSLVVLLVSVVVSTAALAGTRDGRPVGIRIGRAVSGNGTNVEIDVTVTGTNRLWNVYSSTVWVGNAWTSTINYNLSTIFYQYASSTANVPLPRAIEWGDGNYINHVTLFGSAGGPWRGTFSHTYVVPGSYTVTVGDVVGLYVFTPATGNVISGYTRTFGVYRTYVGTFSDGSAVYAQPLALAITNTAAVNTGTGIPTLNVHGLLGLALLLSGTGLLLFRRGSRVI